MKRRIKFAVIGAGNGGLAIAGYLATIGYKVNLYNRTKLAIKDLIKKPIIKLSGEISSRGILHLVTNSIKEAIENVDIIMVTIPATGHNDIALKMAPYLKNGQIIILNPGRTGGALEVYNTIKRSVAYNNLVVAEAQTLIYACRKTSTTSAHIFKTKNEVYLSAIPYKKTNLIIDLIREAYPQFIPSKNIFDTSINNYGAIFHPCPTLLNAGHIDRGVDFEYYTEGITPYVGKYLELIDSERMKIGEALGVKAISAKQWLRDTYNADGTNLYEAIQNNIAYKGLAAPKSIDNRYIYEDVPYSLVPLWSLGKEFGVDTPAIESIIRLAEMITGVDFSKTGRTMKKLGLKGYTVREIHELAMFGKVISKGVEMVDEKDISMYVG